MNSAKDIAGIPPHNALTHCEAERLAILSEEAGEVMQCLGTVVQTVGKILRHGYESHNPLDRDAGTNRDALERELGNFLFAMDLMVKEFDLDASAIEAARVEKAESIKPWLHHQTPHIQVDPSAPVMPDAPSEVAAEL